MESTFEEDLFHNLIQTKQVCVRYLGIPVLTLHLLKGFSKEQQIKA